MDVCTFSHASFKSDFYSRERIQMKRLWKQSILVRYSNGIELPTIQVLFERRRNSYNRDGPEYVNLSRHVSSLRLDRLRNAIFFFPENVSTGSFIRY